MTQDVSGYWAGVLDTGAVKVTLAFRLDPDRGAAVLRTSSYGEVDLPLVRRGEQWRFAAPVVDIALTIWPADDRLTGDCRHAGVAYPMTFERGPPRPRPRALRPQTPIPPFPYEARIVSFAGQDGSRLIGTLTWPSDTDVRGAVVLSTWYGRTDRNERAFGHEPFAIWADALTRLGLATLRYDKRGVGESSGDFDMATTGDLAGDLSEAVAFLRAQPHIAARRIGLFGHSEGGHISADVAAADPDIAFCILLTPTGASEEASFGTELFRAAKAVGGTPLHPERSVALAQELAEAGRTASSPEEGVSRTRAILLREAALGRFPAERIAARAQAAASPWRRYWWNYDHTSSLRRLGCPTLVVFAGRDLQTPPSYHAPPVRAALADNPWATVIELPDLNHFLQRARTGAMSEYGDIEETLAPEIIEVVGGWVSNVLGFAAMD